MSHKANATELVKAQKAWSKLCVVTDKSSVRLGFLQPSRRPGLHPVWRSIQLTRKRRVLKLTVAKSEKLERQGVWMGSLG